MKTLAIDFDGVLSSYTGWKGETHLDPPFPGAIEFLNECVTHDFDVVIFTTRPEELIRGWLIAYGTPELSVMIEVTNSKPPAWLYIDDRCFLFTGTFPSMEAIDNFKPYWQP